MLRSAALPNTDFRDPGAVLSALNDAFPMERQNNMYFTLWYGVYHAPSRTLRHASGGHPPALLLKPSSSGPAASEQLRSPGLIVGGMENSVYKADFARLEKEHQQTFNEKSAHINTLLQGIKTDDDKTVGEARQKLEIIREKEKGIRTGVKDLLKKMHPNDEPRDTDYVFISFVMKYMPAGLIGLLLAVIFCASMSSTSSELNALASTSLVDIYRRSVKKEASETHYLNMSRLLTVVWGLLAILFATLASRMENLIQAVNILGSIFYGTILGIFVVAFYVKYIKANAVFWAAVLAETFVIITYWKTDIGFLWLNPIGCLLVIFFGLIFQALIGRKEAISL